MVGVKTLSPREMQTKVNALVAQGKTCDQVADAVLSQFPSQALSAVRAMYWEAKVRWDQMQQRKVSPPLTHPILARERRDVPRTLTHEMTRPIIKRLAEKANRVYGEFLQRYPGMRGKGVFLLDVASDGSVKNVKVQSTTIRNRDLLNQIKEVLGEISFPPSKEGIIIRFPLNFQPKVNEV